MKVSDKIIEIASADLNKKELKGNSGWEDPEFQKAMENTGWELGQSWCAYWAEKVWVQAYQEYMPEHVGIIKAMFSANAVGTFRNFLNSPFSVTNKPSPGAVVLWMKMKSGKPSYVGETEWVRGHAGIVMKGSYSKSFPTHEGNSNDEGGREGIEVAKLTRKYEFNKDNGLRLLGFVHPLELPNAY